MLNQYDPRPGQSRDRGDFWDRSVGSRGGSKGQYQYALQSGDLEELNQWTPKLMKAQGSGGSFINTASIAGLSGGDAPQAYSAAKAAVINLTRAVAVELAPIGTRSSLSP